jgi:hypothetical protein
MLNLSFLKIIFQMLYKLLLLYALVLTGDSNDLCKCPKKPHRIKSIYFCGGTIHKDCNKETIYDCEYIGENSTINEFMDCKKLNTRCYQKDCFQGAVAIGICHTATCS